VKDIANQQKRERGLCRQMRASLCSMGAPEKASSIEEGRTGHAKHPAAFRAAPSVDGLFLEPYSLRDELAWPLCYMDPHKRTRK
jgi:hypothetical protein